jgi:predicted RNA-binding protein
MAQRWIVTISQDNLQETLKHNQIGLPERRRNLLKKVRSGDTVVFYIGKKREGYGGPRSGVHQFGPIAKVNSEEFFSDVPSWKSRSGKPFPSRLSISVMSEGRVNAAKVIPHLSFIQNKDKWGLYFLTGIRAISEEDYKTLITAIKK